MGLVTPYSLSALFTHVNDDTGSIERLPDLDPHRSTPSPASEEFRAVILGEESLQDVGRRRGHCDSVFHLAGEEGDHGFRYTLRRS